MGGVARRATALFENRNGKSVPTITVETGNEMLQSDNLEDPANRWVVEALNALGVDIVNTTQADLLRLNRLAETGRLQTSNLRSRFVATLVSENEKTQFPVQPFEIKKVTSSSGAEVRVGILGLSSESIRASASGTYETALQKMLPEVERRSDIVILLSRLPEDDLFRLAAQFPGIDVIVNGSSTGEGREFPKVGNTIIVEAARKGIALGILDVEWDDKGHISGFSNKLVPLFPEVAENPALAEVVTKAREEWGKSEEERIKKSPPPAETAAIFAGNQACKICHEKAYTMWQKSGHARAFEALKSVEKLDGECLRCHTTAYGFPGGFVGVKWTPRMASVGCEACHGESADHVKQPQNVHPGSKATRVFGRKVGSQFCLRCHDTENSPAFKFEDYWPKIAH
jgi:2',3'-cyclic-nucleotide 2'-phosphodiesterase (5'-nucleotidase family)